MRRRASGLKKKKGGWPPARWLTWQDTKDINDIAHQLEKAGFGLTAHIIIMPLVGTPIERKKRTQLLIARLGQALKRRGHPHLGITAHQRSPGVDLHTHHVAHIPTGAKDVVERMRRPPEVELKWVYDLPPLLKYLTRERRPYSPDFENLINHRRVTCLEIPGKRWGKTTDLKAWLRDTEK